MTRRDGRTSEGRPDGPSTIADIDAPLTPEQKGNTAFSYHIRKRTSEDLQKDRDAILSTKPADIRFYSKMTKDILEQKAKVLEL